MTKMSNTSKCTEKVINPFFMNKNVFLSFYEKKKNVFSFQKEKR